MHRLELAFVDGVKHYSWPILRFGIAFVLIWFGIQQYLETFIWTGYVPDWAVSVSGLSASTIVLLNASAELICGLFILLGIFTRLASLIMAVHLMIIAIELGWSEIAIRDWGLAAATLAIFLHGPDWLTLEAREKKDAAVKEAGQEAGVL